MIVSAILDSVSEVSFLHPWLFTNDWTAFGDLVRDPIYWHNIWKDLLLQAGYVAVFGTAAWARMTTRDVLAWTRLRRSIGLETRTAPVAGPNWVRAQGSASNAPRA